jgi:dipeptidyl aminopeptidase/acylaminoacyl peptidase
MQKILLVIVISVIFMASACTGGGSSALTVQGEVADTPLSTESATLPPPSVATIVAIPTTILVPSIQPSATVSPTPDPYAGLTINDLLARPYGDGTLEIEEIMAENSSFTRYLITYPSDGVKVYGFMNVPTGDGPFPVIIALHGYIEPERYNTLDYTTGYADALARAGFLVLHPNLRGYQPSEDGPNLFRVGMAIDVLNLIGILKKQAGQPGSLEVVDASRIGLWGHSMGGGISTRVMTVSPDVKAVVLYGAMSGDDQKNYERIFNVFSEGTRGIEELNAPPEAFLRISPINYLDLIQAAISIHHGDSDTEVPVEWSEDLCERLKGLGKQVECFIYPGQPHTFIGEGDDIFIDSMIDFFNQELGVE